ncbi:MAG: hypothetical protein BWY66_02780 [bacterium ADurb.Bin374]|nr:MAG: hypothetical protein BWY66_02780 [bacterium ADurb.Bin374]
MVGIEPRIDRNAPGSDFSPHFRRVRIDCHIRVVFHPAALVVDRGGVRRVFADASEGLLVHRIVDFEDGRRIVRRVDVVFHHSRADVSGLVGDRCVQLVLMPIDLGPGTPGRSRGRIPPDVFDVIRRYGPRHRLVDREILHGLGQGVEIETGRGCGRCHGIVHDGVEQIIIPSDIISDGDIRVGASKVIEIDFRSLEIDRDGGDLRLGAEERLGHPRSQRLESIDAVAGDGDFDRPVAAKRRLDVRDVFAIFIQPDADETARLRLALDREGGGGDERHFAGNDVFSLDARDDRGGYHGSPGDGARDQEIHQGDQPRPRRISRLAGGGSPDWIV